MIGPRARRSGIRPYALDLRYDVPGTPGQVGTGMAIFTADRTGTYQVGTLAVWPTGIERRFGVWRPDAGGR